MSNPWDSLPASRWPTGSVIPPFDPGQGAIPPQAPAARPEWPSFVLDYTTPEAAEVLRQWAEPHASRAESRPPGTHEPPHPADDRLQQMLADTKRQNDLMAWLAQTARAMQWAQAESKAPAASQAVPSPATPDEEPQHKPAPRSSEAGKAG
jgi:hypothetical protein